MTPRTKRASTALALATAMAATVFLLGGRAQSPVPDGYALSPAAPTNRSQESHPRELQPAHIAGEHRAAAFTSSAETANPADESPRTTPAPNIEDAVRIFRESGNLRALRESLWEATRHDPAGTFALLAGLTLSNRLKIDIGGEMLARWTAVEPHAAAAWAEQNRWRGELGGPVAKVADEWARRDPAAALNWAAALEPGWDQVAALIAGTTRWSKTDLSAIAAYVSSLPRGVPRDVMAATLAREFGLEDPLTGLQWALVVEDPVGRERAAAGAIAELRRTDPVRAEFMLHSAGLPPDFRQAVEKRAAGPLPWWH